MSKIIVCADCGGEKEHCAKGLCRLCYTRQYRIAHRQELLEYNQQYRRDHPEWARECSRRQYHKNRGYWRKWRKENPEKVRATTQRYGEKHREEINERQRLRYKENPEPGRAAVRRWAKRNPEKAKAIISNWRKENPEKMKEHRARRRALEVKAEGHASGEQIMARITYYGFLCYLCGGDYEHIDHVIPLSRGGANWPANLRPICASCNLSKGTRLLCELA